MALEAGRAGFGPTVAIYISRAPCRTPATHQGRKPSSSLNCQSCRSPWGPSQQLPNRSPGGNRIWSTQLSLITAARSPFLRELPLPHSVWFRWGISEVSLVWAMAGAVGVLRLLQVMLEHSQVRKAASFPRRKDEQVKPKWANQRPSWEFRWS